ncbi:MAG: hypothetical protein B7Y80_00690 [Hyphomicrobium sp. 32-62-53]|nr:MAG: hypothetical protein B7Z29_14010 [Hyphomicrobium sp. 12-62-95]OYY01865.1 MAG: hypothetical protein B7Y80_00690 [Hyphomicrobium sp. 32-62-53]
MSDRKPQSNGQTPIIEWTPRTPYPHASNTESRTGDILIALFGVALPAAVIIIEAAFRLCAEAFFDPMPTWAHTLLIASVPVTNAIALAHSRQRNTAPSPWLAGFLASSIAVSAFYALLFLPLAPIAVVAILYFGLGLLPFGPATSCLSALALLGRIKAKHVGTSFRRPILIGALTGTAALVALNIPGVATRLGLIWAASNDTTTRERGLSTLRTFGSQQDLLRFTYDTGGKSGGPLSLLFGLTTPLIFDRGDADPMPSPTKVREIFFRTYGVPFNAFPPPETGRKWARFDDFAFDADHGAAQTGGRIKGLSLISSRMDGSIAAADGAGYLEWTFEFRNVSAIDREARLSLMMPQDAVVSRATLWVNGEEREAAYAGRAEARKAYEQVAVQQRRDPLLVTTKGAGRVLAQAFPVPRDGTLKMKIGMTIALHADGSRASFALPAIADRNFTIGSETSHAIWIESKAPLTSSSPAFKSAPIANSGHRLEGTLTDADLARLRPEVIIEQNAVRPLAVAHINGAPEIEQRLAPPSATPPTDPLIIVVDGSLRIRPHAAAINAALANIAPSRQVGLHIAAEPLVSIAPAPWSETHAARIRSALARHTFTGGQDNTPALIEALKTASTEANARLLWIHGPQPLRFEATASLLEQSADRIGTMPAIDHYAIEPGPNELWPDAPWAWRARLLPSHGDVATDLARILTSPARATIGRPASTEASATAPRGSSHIVRLWAHDEILALMMKDPEGNRTEATRLAADLRLVTPVSGAVVLETAAQYQAANLNPVDKGTVPTVPEPHEWALIILAMMLLGYLAHRQRSLAGASA